MMKTIQHNEYLNEEMEKEQVMRHVMMRTVMIMMVEIQTEHLQNKVGCDQEEIKIHQTHEHTETALLVGTKMMQTIQLNVLHNEVMVIRVEQRYEMMET